MRFILAILIFCCAARAQALWTLASSPVAGGGGGGSDPSSISGLKLWLKPESLSGTDGTAISTWSDSSGNGYDATQGTGANQPTILNDAIGTYEAAVFDNSNDYLSITGSGLGMLRNKSGATICVVAYRTASAVSKIFVYVSQGDSSTQRRLVMRVSGSSASQWYMSGHRDDSSSSQDSDAGGLVAINNWTANIGVINWSATTADGYTNSVQTITDTTFGTSGSSSDTDSSAISIGAQPDGTVGIGARICEVIIWDKALSGSELTTLHSYLQTKYAIW